MTFSRTHSPMFTLTVAAMVSTALSACGVGADEAAGGSALASVEQALIDGGSPDGGFIKSAELKCPGRITPTCTPYWAARFSDPISNLNYQVAFTTPAIALTTLNNYVAANQQFNRIFPESFIANPCAQVYPGGPIDPQSLTALPLSPQAQPPGGGALLMQWAQGWSNGVTHTVHLWCPYTSPLFNTPFVLHYARTVPFNDTCTSPWFPNLHIVCGHY